VIALVLAFIGTNVDGLLCLAAAFAVDPPRGRVRAVLVAAFAFAALLFISFAVSLVIGRVGFSLAWFGLLPAGIGVVRLARLIFRDRRPGQEDWLSSGPSIFSIVLATGADNVAVYAPLFALRPLGNASAVAGAYLFCWIAGCTAVTYAAPSLPRIHALKRYLEPAFAILFIAIGVEIALLGRS
jgi:cadmium resistance protein CadD (predicted permease)